MDELNDIHHDVHNSTMHHQDIQEHVKKKRIGEKRIGLLEFFENTHLTETMISKGSMAPTVGLNAILQSPLLPNLLTPANQETELTKSAHFDWLW